MFSRLTSQLHDELETAQKVLGINQSLRELLISQHAALSAIPEELTEEADGSAKVLHAVSRMDAQAPGKLDWAIYDHCATLTRIYAAYERFVGDLVTEFLRLLPSIYRKYSDLPSSITTQHRVGIGLILSKMGGRGPYRTLDEHAVVSGLAAGLSGAPEYAVLADAFFIDRQNLRFDTLVRLFGALGFRQCGRYINRHQEVVRYIREERADSSTPQKELDGFIDYRNEAAHRRVESVLSVDAIAATARFVVALGNALADMVEEGVLLRRMDLAQYSKVLTVTETHYGGLVVVGTPVDGEHLRIGDELLVCSTNGCKRASVDSLQLNGQTVGEAWGDGATELGLKLSKRAAPGAELRRLRIPTEAPASIQLRLEDHTPEMEDLADTDVAEVAEQGEEGGDDADAGGPPDGPS